MGWGEGGRGKLDAWGGFLAPFGSEADAVRGVQVRQGLGWIAASWSQGPASSLFRRIIKTNMAGRKELLEGCCLEHLWLVGSRA